MSLTGLNASATSGVFDILLDVSSNINMLAGTSPDPDPGGSGFAKILLVKISSKNNNFNNTLFILNFTIYIF